MSKANRVKALERALDRSIKAHSRSHVKQWDHVKFSKYGIDQVLCKCCGAAIKGTVVSDEWAETRIINGKTVVFQRLVQAELAGYAEIEILFNDGSKHITHCCAACISHITVDHLEDMYCCDMETWQAEAGRQNTEIVWEANADRIPISFKRVR